jgi:hypothetical protein
MGKPSTRPSLYTITARLAPNSIKKNGYILSLSLDLWILHSKEQHGKDSTTKQLKLTHQACHDLQAIL